MPTRIEEDLPSRFPSVAIYLNDIRDILEIIKNSTGCDAVLRDSEYTYESLDELTKNRGNRIDYFVCHSQAGATPIVRVSIGYENGVSICVNVCEKKVERLIHGDICEVLKKRKLWITHLAGFDGSFGSVVTMISAALAGCAIMFTSACAFSRNLLGAVFGGMLLFAAIAIMACSFIGLLTGGGKWSRVYLVNPHEKPKGFFRRNWEQIALSIFVFFAGAAAKALWDWLTGTK